MQGIRRLAASICALLLCACQSAPVSEPVSSTQAASSLASTDLRDAYRALESSGVPVYTLQADASQVRIYVFRGGAAARAGHNHVLDVARFEGYAAVDALRPQGAQFHLRVPLADLVIDAPDARAQTGGAFAGVRPEADIEGTRRNLLGPKGLDAAAFPHVELRSQAVAGDWPMLIVDVAVTLRGATRVIPVMIEMRVQDERLRARGQFVLRQSEFGIAPFSVLGGLLAVQDAVGIAFEVDGRRGI